MDITTYHINTCMGKSQEWITIKDMGEKDVNTLNSIGYGSEKSYGRGSEGLEIYLNGAVARDNVRFKVQKTKNDNGDFCEQYLITRVEW